MFGCHHDEHASDTVQPLGHSSAKKNCPAPNASSFPVEKLLQQNEGVTTNGAAY